MLSFPIRIELAVHCAISSLLIAEYEGSQEDPVDVLLLHTSYQLLYDLRTPAERLTRHKTYFPVNP